MNTIVTDAPGASETQAIAEISIEQKETEGLSQGQIVRRRFFRHRGALISMIVLAFIVILAFTCRGEPLGMADHRLVAVFLGPDRSQGEQRRSDAEPAPSFTG